MTDPGGARALRQPMREGLFGALGRGLRSVRRYARFGLGLLFALGALLLIDWRSVLLIVGEGFSKAVSPQALGVAVVGQIAALTACAAGLRILSPQLTWRASFLSRWVRDGVGALPVGLPGLGEAAGVRALSLFGIPAAAGVALTTADILAETLAQAAYAVGALLLAPSSLRVAPPPIHLPLAPLAIGALLTAVAAALTVRFMPRAWKAGLKAVLVLVGDSLKSRAFTASFVLHVAAWVTGGVQIFLLAKCLGAPLTLPQALSLEGLVFAVRSAFFFIPAGAGVQEIGLAAVGAAYGLAPVDIAAFALLLRLRDLVVLSPALVAWLVLEARHAVTPLSPIPSPNPGSLPCN